MKETSLKGRKKIFIGSISREINIMCIGAHADDIVLGMGASIFEWAKKGLNIFCYYTTDSSYNTLDGRKGRNEGIVRSQINNALNVLGVKNFKISDCRGNSIYDNYIYTLIIYLRNNY